MRALAGRLAALVPVLLGLSLLTSVLLARVPGDPVVTMLGMEADPAAIAILRARFALDQPLPVRFATWLATRSPGSTPSRST